ncbi:MAG: DUF1553 domain-containing protein [Gemmataceae bacterium]|nr:DUF1553 domain-containing protein [Gemmataceae bacterium]MDW8266091.1 DUF1553 domain-containing protein [Gemmataceae bacterium]
MLWRLTCVCLVLGAGAIRAQADEAKSSPTQKVSYYRDVRPIFQAHCQGCHQPAKARGDYVMTTYEALVKGGASEQRAIVPGHPERSALYQMILPKDGKAEMPKGKAPLVERDLTLIRRWIEEGAVDDTPANAVRRFDQDHPPIYTRPPVIPSLDYSPDGSLLAVAGFHEVLLIDTASDQLVARLIGLSDRIQSVRFSPDGKSLAAVGGQPARMGEVQIWDVANRKLKLSVPVGADTLYGVSWSPDGTKVAFGCPDNTVRAIDANTGEQVLQQSAHTDWVLDTTFSPDGSHLISVSRDETVKLTEVATQRFVDNITSITPGALRGGIQAVAGHPKLDHVVVGGADGLPRAYRIYRSSPRRIGDDANHILDTFPMLGRVFAVRFSADGKRIAAGSSLDGRGEIVVCTYDYATDVPADLQAIMGKVPGTRTPQERTALEEYKKKGVRELCRIPVPQTGMYALAFRPDGQVVAASGADGIVRLYDATDGKLLREFAPAPLTKPTSVAEIPALPWPQDTIEAEKLPDGAKVVGLEVQPTMIELSHPFAYAQLVVTAQLANGDALDATRMADLKPAGTCIAVSRTGLVTPVADGETTLTVSLAGQSASLAVKVTGQQTTPTIDFVRDVNPVLSRLGCNQGTCHGAAKGKAGFKLSLRGYDPVFDVRALTDDHAARRVNIASPDDSLMLLKATAGVPHVGGQLIRPGEPFYRILRAWIASGAGLEPTPKAEKIEIFPINPVIQRPNQRQQMRVLARYPDGQVRDVTQEAFIESGNSEVASTGRNGLLTALRRGEAPVLARYEGNYVATTLTVMGDRTGFLWTPPPVYNRIDELTAAKWQRMKILPSDVCTDAEFIRRVSIDLTGLPPTADEVRAFLADPRDSRVKRDEWVDRLIGSPAYVEHWTNKWADLLQVNRKFLGPEGAAAFRKWIREEVAKNTPYDEFVRKILTATGSNKDNPAASYFKILRDPAPTMENTTHLFLAVRFNCNKCHDHPFERWTQDQYYETAAYFAQVGLKPDPASGNQQIGGTAVEKGKPLYEIVEDLPSGDIKHDRTGKLTPPKFPYPAKFEAPPNANRRQLLAAWITSPDNQYFARSYVNRLWGYLFGVGIIEPIDDIRAGNPPTNPELLDYLTEEFIKSGFNTQHVLKLITKSRTYQLSVVANKWNEDDRINFSHAIARRLPAEVLFDALYRVTGSTSKFPGVPPGTRAAELPDVGIELPSGFLGTFGRPPRESACECERTSGLQLGPVMALVNGQTIAEAIGDPNNAIAKLVAAEADDAKVVNELFLRILNRPATQKEIEAALETWRRLDEDHARLEKALREAEEAHVAVKAQREANRLQQLAKAKQALADYEKELAPKIAEAERQKAERTRRLEAELKSYEEQLPDKLAAYVEQQRKSLVEWVRLVPKRVSSTIKGAKVEALEDASVFVSGDGAGRGLGKGAITVTVETDLRHISALRLEALTDGRLPKNGPGRAADGNFVLTEIELIAAPKSDPKNVRRVALTKPLADFSQERFEIAQAVDGNTNGGNNGWAVSPATGTVHWATFEVKNADDEGGTILTFTLHHQFNRPDFVLGRFRLSAAVTKRPVGLSLPDELITIIQTEPADRTEAENEVLLKHFKAVDKEYKERVKALAESRQPLPIDPKLKEMREEVEFLSKPTPDDPKLVQLRADFAMSTQQMKNKRLVAAQDLAWALINSPAFLFNH